LRRISAVSRVTDQIARRGVVSLIVFIATVSAADRAAADIIDRLLAVVDGTPITQSDVSAAIRLGLVTVPAAPDPVPPVLERLIERRLMLVEVDRYAPPDPADADVDRALEAVRARVGPAALETILAQTGSGHDQLRRFLRDDLRIQSYLQQRFGTIQPTESDVAQYYRDHAAEFGGRSLQQVHDAVVGGLTKERRDAVVRDWVAGLRRRANVTVLTL
jgi:hypothetical protein